ncbi:hypothetical protein IR083_07195 [Dysgonomonas sp. GY75]|uniref:hypothetical protein n=1 Tax=Dysgonomonas sp. GY75 TaxID=2780419 RepID=UPI0018834541|nr:hypothetical protein [Dysgonomonas sp. GY75]MBF0648600.1 hypothetical protein [Dysgonomonas sp. GY75]
MKIIRNKYLPPKGYSAMMLFGFILARPGAELSPRTIRHEETHKKQMLEMLVIFFYLWYGVEYLIRICIYGNMKEAYRNISFEREAYSNDNPVPYKRKPFAWIKFLKQEKPKSK